MAKQTKRRKQDEPDEYLAVMLLHWGMLAQIAEKRTTGSVAKTYNKATQDVVSKLHKIHRALKGTRPESRPLSGYEAQAAVAQVRALLPQMSLTVYNAILAGARDAQTAGLRTIIDSVEKLERDLTKKTVALPLKQAARFNNVLEQRVSTIERSTEEAVQAYTRQTAEDVERQLSLAVALEDTFEEAMQRVEDTLLGARWKTERIARTEAAYGFNASLYDGVSDSSRELPDIGMRWTELVYDTSGEPMDARVATDSLALHGQICDANGIFTMPEDPRVRPAMWGETYRFPPNRPNDRAVLVPWRPTWGVPGYKYVGGRPMGIARDGTLTGPLPPNLNPTILPIGRSR